jgi:hypothetical protein
MHKSRRGRPPSATGATSMWKAEWPVSIASTKCLASSYLSTKERFIKNLQNSIDWWAERNRGRGRGRYRNRNRERRRHLAFGHEKLDLYRAAIASVGWASRSCDKRQGHRNAKDQRLRASQAMALKTVEGKGPRVTAKRRTGIDAGILKSHEARRWSALRFRTCCKCARRCPQTTTISRRHCSIVLWPC